MKNTTISIAAAALAATLLAASAAALEVTVAPGDDIAAALARLRSERKPGEDAALVLEDGLHVLSKTVALGKDDAGVVIRAEHPGKAIVASGWTFKGSDMKPVKHSLIGSVFADTRLQNRLQKQVRGKCLAIDVPEAVRAKCLDGISTNGLPQRLPRLTVDGSFQTIAHWPNGRERWWFFEEMKRGAVEREITAHGKPKKVRNSLVEVERAKGWDLANSEAFLEGCFSGWGYEYGCVGILGTATNGVVEFFRGTEQGGNTYSRFVFFNLVEEIDEPGEWAYDTGTHKIVLYPMEGFCADSLCALGTMDAPFIKVETDGVRIEGIVFSSKRDQACVVVEKGSGNLIAGCRFSGVNRGVRVGGRRNRVQSCDFSHIGNVAAVLIGGDNKTLDHSGNTVENCLFEEFGLMGNGNFMEPGDAVVAKECGNVIRNCLIRGAIGHAVDFRGAENLMEYCRIYDVCRDHDDSGAVYANGDYSYGSILRYNDISTSVGMSSGIYLDDFCCGVEVYGNILRDIGHWGVFISGGRDNKIDNNLFTGCWGGIKPDNRGLFWPAWRDREKFWNDFKAHWGIDEGSPFVRKYPQAAKWFELDGTNMITAPVDNTYRDNLFVDLPGYPAVLFIAHNKDIPDSRIIASGNMFVRTRGPVEGRPDFSTGDPSKIPDNKHTQPRGLPNGYYMRKLLPEIKVLDGTPDEPIDLGFVNLPPPTFDVSDYYWEQQGWVDEDKLREKRMAGYVQRPYEAGDLSLKPDARLLKEMPGFKPIPFDKIGLYEDEWRKEVK